MIKRGDKHESDRKKIIYNQIPNRFPKICEYIATEECSELIKEICKSLRGKIRRDNLIEEIIDVEICINWLKKIYNISEEELTKWNYIKENRLLQRYNENRFK